MKKICKSCLQVLKIDNFTPSKNVKDGYENKCKKCRQQQRNLCHTLKCSFCGNIFTSSLKSAKYCSAKCQHDSRKKRVIKNCAFCNAEKEVIQSLASVNSLFFCDTQCKADHQKESMLGEKNPNYGKISHKCDGCGKNIEVVPSKIEKQKYVFCSNECYQKNIGNYFTGEDNPFFKEEVQANCTKCGKTFKRKPGQMKSKQLYCSSECYYADSDRPERVSRIETKCSYCGKLIRILKCQITGKTRIYCSRKCQNLGHGKYYSSENHPRYNENLEPHERITNRKYNDYYNWRKTVYERDQFTCQSCGDNQGGNLVAHHIESYRANRSKRTLIKNGITLCKKCHKMFHDNFGYGSNTISEFEEFFVVFSLLGKNG